MTKKIQSLLISYTVVILLGFLSKLSVFNMSLDFLWIPYLAVATTVAIKSFDLLVDYIDFDNLSELKEENKSVYIVALAILSAGFAIAIAIFLK